MGRKTAFTQKIRRTHPEHSRQIGNKYKNYQRIEVPNLTKEMEELLKLRKQELDIMKD